MEIVKPTVLDILEDKRPALSSTSDMPIVETKPDAQNEGKPPSQDAPEKAAATEDEAKTTSESATEQTEETPGDTDARKPARGVQKRLDELAKQREEQRARAEAAERRLDLLLSQAKPKPAEVIDDTEEAPARPSRSSFNDPDLYEAALVDYSDKKAAWSARREVRHAIAEQTRQYQERQQVEAHAQVQRAYSARVEKAVQKYPDYHDVAESPDVQISIPMASAILRSDNGPDVAYYLGSHPDEAKRIHALHPELQLVEFGLIVAKLATPPKPASTPTPKPIKPIAASATASAGESDEEPDMDTYAERRRKSLMDEQQRHVQRTRH
jgi:hypothetical protein